MTSRSSAPDDGKPGGRRRDRISGAVLAAAGGVLVWQAARLRLGGLHAPGPGFFPLVVAGVIVLLALGLVAFPTGAGQETGSFSLRRFARVGRVYLALLAYFLLLEPAGFVAATFLLISYLSRVIGRQRVSGALLTAVLVTALSYGLFGVVLKGELPKGFLGL